MAQDLPGFLELLKGRKPDDFVAVSGEVDPDYEITATVVKMEREAQKRPVMLFENVKGSDFQVLTNLHASRGRLALAMDAAPHEILPTFLRAMENPVPPREVNTGPAKDVILTGKDVNLEALPRIIHHGGDAGPYITAATSFAKYPDGDRWNCAYNRLMLRVGFSIQQPAVSIRPATSRPPPS